MRRDERLAMVLSEFAHTMITDFPIQAILDHLVERTVELLPVSAAGVGLISPGRDPHYVAASDDSAMRFERLQTELGEGPCLVAHRSGRSVTVPDLRADETFPAFAPAGVAAGVGAVFAFPLSHGGHQLGALDLYRRSAGRLDGWEMATAQTLADVTTAYLLNARTRAQVRETSDRFRDAALHDPLTGLPNRSLLQERLQHAAARGRRSHADVALLFVDLDRFKHVNDTHGHQVGDELLVAVGRRLRGLLRPGDTLARLHGDEFVVLCEDLASPFDAQALAGRIVAALDVPFVLSDVVISITGSAGIAVAGPSEDMPGQLMRDADEAMYRAKRGRGDPDRVLDIRRQVITGDRVDLGSDLRRALGDDELDVHYQPIVRTGDLHPTGVEALLRWTHPVRGPVQPQDVVAVAEQTGLIGDLGRWVLERACTDRLGWSTGGAGEPLTVAVNVAASQVMAHGFVQTVEGVLQRTGTDPATLLLEVTEGVLLGDDDRAAAVLAHLRALGVGVALDDFGSGYSSLRYLRAFPADVVKIDGAFVGDLGRDPVATAIVAAVTDLAHVLGLSVTVEGVETRAQHEEILALECDTAQGYFYARPMPAPRVAAWLHEAQPETVALPR